MDHAVSPAVDHTPDPSGPRMPGTPPAWAEFSRVHAAWLAALPCTGDPLYALPARIIRKLHRMGRLDDAARDAVLAFRLLCKNCRAVGFCGGRPIASDLLSLKPRPNPREAKEDAAPPHARRRRIPRSAFMDRAEMRARRRGYAGWLLTDPDFRTARDAIRGEYDRLPDGSRPPFPLGRGLDLDELAAAPDFRAAFLTFCDRWGLAGMATWDLPDPQGPDFPGASPADATDPTPAGIHLFIPFHFPVTGYDDLLRRIREWQRDLVAKARLDASAVGLPHFKAYATIFVVLHWQRVILGRRATSGRRKELIVPMEGMIAQQAGISTDQVRKWRKAISACLRGERHKVKAFDTRA